MLHPPSVVVVVAVIVGGRFTGLYIISLVPHHDGFYFPPTARPEQENRLICTV
jgi:hypothetical protein